MSFSGIKRKQCDQAAGCDQTENREHVLAFIHPCKFGSSCKNLDVESHSKLFTHLCPEMAFCTNNRNEHREKLLHYCNNGFDCTETNDFSHILKYVHPCKFGIKCKLTKNPLHIMNFHHPCSFGDQCIYTKDITHRELFTHPCMYGVNCRNQTDPKHVKRFIHPCKNAENCKDISNTIHAHFFHHPCKHGFTCSKVLDFHHSTLFTHPWKMGSSSPDVAKEIENNMEVCDLLISMTSSASVSEVVRFNPYPTIKYNDDFPFMNNNEKNVAKVQDILCKIPAVRDMKNHKNVKDLQKTLDAIDPLVFPLLTWIFQSCQASLIYIKPEKQFVEMKTPFQFVMQSSPLEATKKFSESKKKHGSFFAWHGSSFGNWHCIVRMGLKNYSGTELQSCGAAYGPGIYLAVNSSTSFSYAKLAKGWPKSLIGEKIQCLSLCEGILTGKDLININL